MLCVVSLILVPSTFAAAVPASRRARDIKGSLLLSFYAIAAGSGVVIAGMLATGTLHSDIAILVPVGSMIIANAMNACAQSIERFSADVTAHVGQVEAGPALGGEPAGTVAAFLQNAGYPSLPPRLFILQSLGLDTGRDGRHDGVGCQSDLCRHLPVYHRRHDLSGIGHSGPARHAAYPNACLLAGSAIDAPPRGAAQAEARTCQCAISSLLSD